MKVNTIVQTVLTAEEGCYLTNGETYGRVVIIPSAEDAQNWQEITDEEYEKREETHEEDISVPF